MVIAAIIHTSVSAYCLSNARPPSQSHSSMFSFFSRNVGLVRGISAVAVVFGSLFQGQRQYGVARVQKGGGKFKRNCTE